jgi:AIR synthase-related protein
VNVQQLVEALRGSSGFRHKSDIHHVLTALDKTLGLGATLAANPIRIGDDCAAIPDGDGFLLLAIEGLIQQFVERLPWFAGYCGVMVNVSDIYAMGGRPLAVVDALWSADRRSANELVEGMAAAAKRYAVPIVGGHSNNRSAESQLAVAILGRAKRLLTSFNARPADELVMAVDLRGAYYEPHAYWNASTGAPAERLRADLEILPQLAESGECDAAKDISMAGALGTALMLLESSQVGALIDLEKIPRPAESMDDAALLRWLLAFPSYGFVLSVRPAHVPAVLERFHARGLAAAAIGRAHSKPLVELRSGSDTAILWNIEAEHFVTPARAVPELLECSDV